MSALFRKSCVVLAVVLATFVLSVRVAEAVDGQVIINQNRAIAGGVTPGDTAGFPVTISQPGSYRLSGNLTVPDQETAIEVTADNVTLDLNGFSIFGPGLAGNGDGVYAAAGRNVTVMNGAVRGMGNNGVFLGGGNSRIETVMAIDNGEAGIFVGTGSTVVSSVASGNGGRGIVALSGSTVLGNAARFNFSFGLAFSSDVGYAHNVATQNNGGGQQVSGGIQMGGNVCGFAACP